MQKDFASFPRRNKLMERNSPLKVMAKVLVIDLLSAAAVIVTVELFFLARVLLPHGTMLRGV